MLAEECGTQAARRASRLPPRLARCGPAGPRRRRQDAGSPSQPAARCYAASARITLAEDHLARLALSLGIFRQRGPISSLNSARRRAQPGKQRALLRRLRWIGAYFPGPFGRRSSLHDGDIAEHLRYRAVRLRRGRRAGIMTLQVIPGRYAGPRRDRLPVRQATGHRSR
jgi:hypothetical protein